jgi:hypothetical protein
MTDDDTSLDAFDTSAPDDAGDEWPTVSIYGNIKIRTPDGARVVARWGQSPELGARVALADKREHHRIHKLGDDGAFAFSTEALDLMTGIGVRRILIREPDTGDVYDYGIEDFTEWGEPVPPDVLDHEDDPQTWVDRADPLDYYPGHAGAVER